VISKKTKRVGGCEEMIRKDSNDRISKNKRGIPVIKYVICAFIVIGVVIGIIGYFITTYGSEFDSLKSDIKSLREEVSILSLTISSLQKRLDDLQASLKEIQASSSASDNVLNVTFIVTNMSGKPLNIVVENLHISPEIYDSTRIINGSVVTITGMNKFVEYTISIEWPSPIYNATAAGRWIFHPEELDGERLLLPVGDVEMLVIDKFNMPIRGAIVKMANFYGVSDFHGKVLLKNVPLQRYDWPITYYVEVEYAGRSFDFRVTFSKAKNFAILCIEYT